MQPPLAGYKDSLPPNARAILDHVLQCSAVGTADDVAASLKTFQTRTGVDEIIVASSMYDHAARKHSVALTMEASKALYIRSEARRVGKESVSTCRSRWAS